MAIKTTIDKPYVKMPIIYGKIKNVYLLNAKLKIKHTRQFKKL